MLKIKRGVNLEVKLGVGSKPGSKNSVLAFLKCTDIFVLAFLKCTAGSVLVFLMCMDGSVLAHLRFPMQSAPTRFPQWGNSEVPQLLCKKSTKMLNPRFLNVMVVESKVVKFMLHSRQASSPLGGSVTKEAILSNSCLYIKKKKTVSSG